MADDVHFEAKLRVIWSNFIAVIFVYLSAEYMLIFVCRCYSKMDSG